MDRHDLYETCLQSPAIDATLLRAIHNGTPRVLAEDFAAGAATSQAWTALDPNCTAIATDHNADVLERASHNTRVIRKPNDVLQTTDPADIVFAGNFSICERHTRKELVEYLTHARSRLNERGILACDLYGGTDAYELGEIETHHEGAPLPNVTNLVHIWEQRHANPLTARVVNSVHFRWTDASGAEQRIDDAFVYNWRLWTIPELREAMLDAGFTSTEVFHRTDRAEDEDGNVYVHPIESPDLLEDPHFVFIVGRTD